MRARFRAEERSQSELPGVLVLHLSGSVRYQEAPELRAAILQRVAQTSASQVVLQLGEVEQLDTSGAAVLVESLVAARKRGLELLLCSPSESVLKIFRLAGFEDVLGQCTADPRETRRRLLARAEG